MPDRNGEDVMNRFLEEQVHIRKYVAAAFELAHIDHRTVRGININLKNAGLAFQIKLRRDPTSRAYARSEIEALISSIDAIQPEIASKLARSEQEFDNEKEWLPIPSDFQEWYWEFVEYITEQIGESDVSFDRTQMIERFYSEKVENDPELPEDEQYATSKEATVKALINNALDHVVQSRALLNLQSLRSVKDKCEQIKFAARMTEPAAEINILRQGFILLVTAFDAAVFDITRIVLRNNLFILLPSFAKAENVTVTKMATANSFEQFKEKLIDDILDGFYVNGLLHKVREIWSEFFKEPKDFLHLIEIVKRRNAHVHNRGLVNERYLDRHKETGKPFFNIYNLNFGQIAPIDEAYWEDANKRCVDGVRRLTEWEKTFTSGLPS